MPQKVNVIGIGPVNFPDDWTPAQIESHAAVLTKEWQAGQADKNKQLAAKSAQPTAEETRLSNAPRQFLEGATAEGTYLGSGPGKVLSGATDIARGNFKHGAADVVRGAGVSALPFAPVALAVAPAAVLGGLALGGGTELTARGLGADEDTATLLGAGAGALGGAGTARLLPGAVPNASAPLREAGAATLRGAGRFVRHPLQTTRETLGGALDSMAERLSPTRAPGLQSVAASTEGGPAASAVPLKPAAAPMSPVSTSREAVVMPEVNGRVQGATVPRRLAVKAPQTPVGTAEGLVPTGGDIGSATPLPRPTATRQPYDMPVADTPAPAVAEGLVPIGGDIGGTSSVSPYRAGLKPNAGLPSGGPRDPYSMPVFDETPPPSAGDVVESPAAMVARMMETQRPTPKPDAYDQYASDFDAEMGVAPVSTPAPPAGPPAHTPGGPAMGYAAPKLPPPPSDGPRIPSLATLQEISDAKPRGPWKPAGASAAPAAPKEPSRGVTVDERMANPKATGRDPAVELFVRQNPERADMVRTLRMSPAAVLRDVLKSALSKADQELVQLVLKEKGV